MNYVRIRQQHETSNITNLELNALIKAFLTPWRDRFHRFFSSPEKNRFAVTRSQFHLVQKRKKWGNSIDSLMCNHPYFITVFRQLKNSVCQLEFSHPHVLKKYAYDKYL